MQRVPFFSRIGAEEMRATGEQRRAADLRALIGGLAVAFLVSSAHLLQVLLWSEPVPYWDQWDAEILLLLRPWVDGELTIPALWAQHAEHRILLSRLLVLALFELNGGEVDNLVEASANTLIFGATYGALFFYIQRELIPAAKLAFGLALIATACLPFNWENTLVGFQSGFYFMLLSTVLGICFAATGEAGVRLFAKILFVALCGIFSLASGALMLPIIGLILTIRVWQRELPAASTLGFVSFLAGLFLIAVTSTEIPEAHLGLRASSMQEWESAFVMSTSWPFASPTAIGAIALWLPAAFLAFLACMRRSITRGEQAVLGLGGLVLLQCAAIAYSRGNPTFSAASRYSDVLALGLFANIASALILAGRIRRSGPGMFRLAIGTVPIGIMGLATVIAMHQRFTSDLDSLRKRHELSLRQMENVSAFLVSGNPATLDKPHLHIPYHDGQVLAGILGSPTIRSILPSSLWATSPNDRPKTASPWLGRTLRTWQSQVRRSALYRDGMRSLIELPTHTREAEPLILRSSDVLDGRFQAPRAGTIRAVHIMLGTYSGRSDGSLASRFESTTATVISKVDVASANDNELLRIPLDPPADVTAGEQLSLEIRYEQATEPLAVWLSPALSDGSWARTSEGEPPVIINGKSPRIAIEYTWIPPAE